MTSSTSSVHPFGDHGSGPRRPTVLACGDTALLCELDDLAAVLALAAALRAADLPQVRDVVPAARTVLVVAGPGADLAALRRAVLDLRVDAADLPAAGPTVEIPVVYDGADLTAVAWLTGLTEQEVVAAHTGTPWRVGFGGFAPGFAYLTEGDPRLRVARRDEPRTRVPPGAVGLAGEFSGVYPRASPGGWQLIGRTDAVLWDPQRDPPALLAPGGWVRFVEAGSSRSEPPARYEGSDTERGGDHAAPAPRVHPPPGRDTPAAGATSTGSPSGPPAMGHALQVLATGPLALVEDLGRSGLAASGVGPSGAADRCALRLANRLVGNAQGAAGIEVTLGGLAVRAHRWLLVALAGAPAPADVDGTPVAHHTLLTLHPGQRLRLDAPTTGLRSYLAVRGGIGVEPVLGSRSSDVLAGLGPTPLAAGDLLHTGADAHELPTVDVAPVPLPTTGTVTLRAVAGPRADLLEDPAALFTTTWTASARSDRVGIRLEGGRLRHAGPIELPSEGTLRGAVQVPPGGQPVLFLADAPVTGGYPVAAVVLDADTDDAAQVRPGQRVRFRPVEPSWQR